MYHNKNIILSLVFCTVTLLNTGCGKQLSFNQKNPDIDINMINPNNNNLHQFLFNNNALPNAMEVAQFLNNNNINNNHIQQTIINFCNINTNPFINNVA